MCLNGSISRPHLHFYYFSMRPLCMCQGFPSGTFYCLFCTEYLLISLSDSAGQPLLCPHLCTTTIDCHPPYPCCQKRSTVVEKKNIYLDLLSYYKKHFFFAKKVEKKKGSLMRKSTKAITNCSSIYALKSH